MSWNFRMLLGWMIAAAGLATSGRSQEVDQERRAIRLPAQVEPYERTQILAKASGFVGEVHVDIGDDVQRGQLLARLSIPEMEKERLHHQAMVDRAAASVSQAEAQVASAESEIIAVEAKLAAAKAMLEQHSADIQLAQSELNRVESLVSSRAINESLEDEKRFRLRSVQASLSVAEADIHSAQANLSVAESRLKKRQADLEFARAEYRVEQASLEHTETLMEYANIVAPFDGTVSFRGIDTGDFVESGKPSQNKPLFIVNRMDRFRIVFDVPESSSAIVDVGLPVELRLDAMKDKPFRGEVVRTSRQLDGRTRTLRTEAEVNDPKEKLIPGMYGMISFQLPSN